MKYCAFKFILQLNGSLSPVECPSQKPIVIDNIYCNVIYGQMIKIENNQTIVKGLLQFKNPISGSMCTLCFKDEQLSNM